MMCPAMSAVWINAYVNRPQDHPRRQLPVQRFVLFVTQVLRDLEWQDPAIPVMAQDQVVRDLQRPPEQFLGGLNFLARKRQRLRVRKFERRREIEGEIVAQFVLRQRHAVPIHDLAAGRGNIENVRARQLLRFVGGHDRLVHLRRRRFGRRLLREQQPSRRGRPGK